MAWNYETEEMLIYDYNLDPDEEIFNKAMEKFELVWSEGPDKITWDEFNSWLKENR